MAVDWNHPLAKPLDVAEPRPSPTGSQSDKKNYAERLSRELAVLVADALRTRREFKGITPTAEGKSHEVPTVAEGGKKRLDVRLMNPEVGLVFSLSVKTYSFQDYSPKSGKFGRFQKNVVRNDHELRAEAGVVHHRQPYAVLVAVVFMNRAAAFDAGKKHSSFAHAVFTFRKRAGRNGPHDPRFDRFEKVYIGLYDPDGPERGRCLFFDVENPPPRNGEPAVSLDLRQVVAEIGRQLAIRNDIDYTYEDATVMEDDSAELATFSELADITDDDEELDL